MHEAALIAGSSSFNPVTAAERLGVALIADFIEEQWPSMDLVADKLYQHILQDYASEYRTELVRPPMRRRFTALPIVNQSRVARNADRVINRMLDYSRLLRQKMSQFGLFHILDHSYAHLALQLPSKRTIVTCHDLDAFRCVIDPVAEPRPRWFVSMSRRILQGMSSCAAVICVSETVRRQIMSYGLVPAERLHVVHNGVDETFTPSPDPVADTAAAQLMGEAGRGAPLLLHVGSTIPRKRIDVLLQIVASVRERIPGVRLIRVGGSLTPEQTRLMGELRLTDCVHTLPFLPRNVLAAVYRRASLILIPSEAEGFGLPVLEALACGCPVIASDLPVLREVAGQAAVFCSVADIEAWSDTVIRHLKASLSLDDSEKRLRIAFERAKQFSWSATARKTVAIYRYILNY